MPAPASNTFTTTTAAPPARMRPRATGAGVAFGSQSPVRVSVTKPERRENNRLTGTARREVIQKAEGLALNSPYVEGAVANAADYRGPVTPYPATTDSDYNAEITPWFQRTFLDRPDWDASGNFSFAQLQKLMWLYHDISGECFSIDTHLEEDNRLSRPLVRLIPALMCDSPAVPFPSREWIDGIRVGLHHRAVEYHFLHEESATGQILLANRAGFLVKPEQVFHFARRTSIGGAHGISRFLTSGNDVIDATMMDKALHRLFDLAAKLSGVITKDKDTSPDIIKPVSGGAFSVETLASGADESEDNAEDPDNPEKLDVEIISEQLAKAGATLVDFSDEPGKDFEVKQLGGLMPDVAAVHAAALERMAMPWGLPVQVLFCVFSGVFNVTGPGFRISLARGSRWRSEELRRIRPWAVRAAMRHLAWGIQTKQIPAPRKSLLDPVRVECRTEPDLTIDEQRDVKNDALRLQMGVTSEKELAHLYGRALPDVIQERVEFINDICTALGDRKQFWGPNFREKQDPAQAGAENQPAAA